MRFQLGIAQRALGSRAYGSHEAILAEDVSASGGHRFALTHTLQANRTLVGLLLLGLVLLAASTFRRRRAI